MAKYGAFKYGTGVKYGITDAFAYDTFTAPDGTNLLNHTGEAGATWDKHPTLATVPSYTILAGRVYNSGTSGSLRVLASGQAASDEHDVTGTFRIMSVDAISGRLGGRGNLANTDNYYYAVNPGTPSIVLWRQSAGTTTSLGSVNFAGTLVPGTDHTVTLEIRDAAKRLLHNGTPFFSSTDNVITTGRLININNTASTATTGVHFDEIVATNPSSAVTLDLTGSSSGFSSASGSLRAVASLSGSASGASMAAGDLTLSKASITLQLSGTSSGTSSATGDLAIQRKLSLTGSSAGVSSATGTFRMASGLSATAAGTSAASASIRQQARLTAEAAGIAFATGTLTAVSQGGLSGVASGSSLATGQLRASYRLTGSASGASEASASPAIFATLAGLAAGSSLATGQLTYTKASVALSLSGLAAGSSLATGNLSIAYAGLLPYIKASGVVQQALGYKTKVGGSLVDIRRT